MAFFSNTRNKRHYVQIHTNGIMFKYTKQTALCPNTHKRHYVKIHKTNGIMLKYTKRLLSVLLFWCQELKLRRKECAEFEKIEDEEWRHPMAGFGYYMTMQHNRAERKKQHDLKLQQIQ